MATLPAALHLAAAPGVPIRILTADGWETLAPPTARAADYPPPFEPPGVEHLAPYRPGSLPPVGSDPWGDDSRDRADEPVWTLAYEAEGSDDAAWTLRHGTGANTAVHDVNATLGADDTHAARSWATLTLAQRHGVAVTVWLPHRPGPGTAPAHWTAQERA